MKVIKNKLIKVGLCHVINALNRDGFTPWRIKMVGEPMFAHSPDVQISQLPQFLKFIKYCHFDCFNATPFYLIKCYIK